MAKRRSCVTLSIFASAMLVSVFAPRFGFALICCALLPYLTAGGARRAAMDTSPQLIVAWHGNKH
jgi:hypothetical protein